MLINKIKIKDLQLFRSFKMSRHAWKINHFYSLTNHAYSQIVLTLKIINKRKKKRFQKEKNYEWFVCMKRVKTSLQSSLKKVEKFKNCQLVNKLCNEILIRQGGYHQQLRIWMSWGFLIKYTSEVDYLKMIDEILKFVFSMSFHFPTIPICKF